MATYSYTAPTVDSRDEVRFMIQDTDDSDWQFSDEEIDYVMSAVGTGISAAIFLAKRLMAKYARFVDTSVGQVRESASQRVAQYKQIVDDLQQSQTEQALPTFGGVDAQAVLSASMDESQVQPSFTRGQFDNPYAVGTPTDPDAEC